MSDPSLSTGALADAAGVGLQTVRYYERRGLLPEPRRSAAGHRRYEASDVRRLRFIRRAQELGFTLDEVQELLQMRVDPGRSCTAVAEAADAVIDRVAAKVRDLGRIRETLRTLRSACDRGQATDDCPILDALED